MATQRAAETRPRVRLDPTARREQIVQEATRLIAERGFNAVSLADVATACDIRKPSVLHYFPSMAHLLRAVLERRDEQDFRDAGAEMPPADPDSARAFYTGVLERNLLQPELVRLYHILGAEALSPQHPAHRYFADRAAASLDAIERTLTWKKRPRTGAVALLAFMQGIEIEWLHDPDLDVLAAWAEFCDPFFARP